MNDDIETIRFWLPDKKEAVEHALYTCTCGEEAYMALDRLEAELGELRDAVIALREENERYQADQERERPFVEAYREARVENEKLRAERNKLAAGIAGAAYTAGIYNGEVALTGPQLIQLTHDLSREVKGLRKNQCKHGNPAYALLEAENKRLRAKLDDTHESLVELTDLWTGWAAYAASRPFPEKWESAGKILDGIISTLAGQPTNNEHWHEYGGVCREDH